VPLFRVETKDVVVVQVPYADAELIVIDEACRSGVVGAAGGKRAHP
jgi:hypothetical protein